MMTFKYMTLLGVASIFMGCSSNSDQTADANRDTYEVTVPWVFIKPVSIPELNGIFEKAPRGKMITLRLYFKDVDVWVTSDIHLDKGEAVFYSTNGEFRYVEGDSVKSIPGRNISEKTFHFDRNPNINLLASKQNGVSEAQMLLDMATWEREYADGDGKVWDKYCRQPLECQSKMIGACVVLKFCLSNDFSGHIGPWDAYKPK